MVHLLPGVHSAVSDQLKDAPEYACVYDHVKMQDNDPQSAGPEQTATDAKRAA